jgi:hypothetical protein
MALTVELVTEDVTAALLWESLRVTESIGQPDELSVDVIGILTSPDFTQPVIDAFANPQGQLGAVVRLGSDVLFSGPVRLSEEEKPAKGVLKRSLKGTGWEFLAARRLVGVPNGSNFLIQGEDEVDRLPTAVAIDPAAIGQPTAGSVTSLWTNYWIWPGIDLTTYVSDILPVGVSVEDITWSGTDLDGATSDLAAYGSASALWWLANDSPDAQLADAPNLALHFGVLVLPDPGETEDDLLAGFPMADQPTVVAPYEIDNDTPNGTTRIMPNLIRRSVDHGGRTDGFYVRGATGYTEEVLEAPPGWPVPYQIGLVIEGGTGWASAGANGFSGGRYGEEYLDAPAATTKEQRDSFGLASLQDKIFAKSTYTIVVTAYDGWHKGQAVKVTDADFGLDEAWLLIRSVEMTAKSPLSDAFQYTLTCGDTLSAQLGYALRKQRLAEQRKEIAPATQFVMYVGDLLLAPGETAPITGQLANDAGKAMPVKGVPAQWFLMVNGVNLTNPEDTGSAFYLSALVSVTDAAGQITCTLNAGAGATAADAAAPFAKVAL